MRIVRLQKAVSIIASEIRNNIENHRLPKLVRDEIKAIISEYVEEIYKIAAVNSLEKRIVELKKADLSSIAKVLDIILEYHPPKYTLTFADEKTREVDPIQKINELKSWISNADGNQIKLGSMEILFRLELVFDSKMNEIMMAFEKRSPVFKRVKQDVLAKLKKVRKDDLLLLWADLKSKFRNKDDDHHGYVFYKDIIPEDFWDISPKSISLDEVAERYADFIVEYKPLTVRRMIAEGYNAYPVGPLGIARSLALSSSQGKNNVSEFDVLVIRTLSKVISLFEKITYANKSELARAINANQDSFVFDGEFFQAAKKELEEMRNNSSVSFVESLSASMERLNSYAMENQSSGSKVERLLFNYKLSREVSPPDISAGKKNEIALQKDLCKFLIENDIVAYGKIFGRSQIDFYIKEGELPIAEEYVVETKVFRRGRAVNPSVIKANLVQLQSYMDIHKQPRGILAIYNYSDDLIYVPDKRWLHGQYWILVVNIGTATASKRKRSLKIVESSSPKNLIDIIVNA